MENRKDKIDEMNSLKGEIIIPSGREVVAKSKLHNMAIAAGIAHSSTLSLTSRSFRKIHSSEETMKEKLEHGIHVVIVGENHNQGIESIKHSIEKEFPNKGIILIDSISNEGREILNDRGITITDINEIPQCNPKGSLKELVDLSIEKTSLEITNFRSQYQGSFVNSSRDERRIRRKEEKRKAKFNSKKKRR